MSRLLRRRVEQLSETIESYLSILIASPVLLSLVLGSWVAILQLFTDGSPLVAFALMVPIVFVVQYSVTFGAESVFEDATTASSIERLKRRYAEGEITHAEFETRADRLLSIKTAVRSADTGANALHTSLPTENATTSTATESDSETVFEE